jgi:Predicted kinase related to galactokinase and mevalonate kinase
MIITKTPMRISFFGGGTDLPVYYKLQGGAVVSTAINKNVYITVNKKFDKTLRVSYSKTENVNCVNEIQHGIVRECMKMVGIDGGIEVTCIADMPAGTGLGSSSSFTVGLLNALYTYAGNTLSAQDLAERACEIEIGRLGNPIGKQDQYAAAFGGQNFFEFDKNGSVKRSRIPLSEDDIQAMNRKLIMFYSGVTRSANDILSEQQKRTADKINTLDFMKNQAVQMGQVLCREGFSEDFGAALHEGWMKKKSIVSSISNGDIDEIYERALAAGALGGKLLGAGGGGFLLFYCDEEKQSALKQAVGLKEVDFRLSRYGSRVIYFG